MKVAVCSSKPPENRACELWHSVAPSLLKQSMYNSSLCSFSFKVIGSKGPVGSVAGGKEELSMLQTYLIIPFSFSKVGKGL